MLVGAPLHRAGAMFSHLLDLDSHTVHLYSLPTFLMVCPPRCAGRSSTCFDFVFAPFFFGLAVAVSLFGCDGWLFALKVA